MKRYQTGLHAHKGSRCLQRGSKAAANAQISHRQLDIEAIRLEVVERLAFDVGLGLKEFTEEASITDLAAMNLVLFTWSTSKSKSLTEAVEAVFPPTI